MNCPHCKQPMPKAKKPRTLAEALKRIEELEAQAAAKPAKPFDNFAGGIAKALEAVKREDEERAQREMRVWIASERTPMMIPTQAGDSGGIAYARCLYDSGAAHPPLRFADESTSGCWRFDSTTGALVK